MLTGNFRGQTLYFDVVYPGSSAMLVVKLADGESCKAEMGAMVARSQSIQISGKIDGGFVRAARRALFGAEGFFFQTLVAQGAPGEIRLAPPELGDIKILDMRERMDFFLQAGAFLAAFGDVQIDTRLQSPMQGLFSGEGAFVLQCTGVGAVAVSAFGAIDIIDIPEGEEHVVDNGHLVAWSGDLSYSIIKSARSWWDSLTTGEGLACRFTGPGTVWIQSRNPSTFFKWMKRTVSSK